MAPRRCPQLTAAVAFVLTIAAAGDPASSLLHSLEHLEPSAAAESNGDAPHEAPGAACDVCQSLSHTRAALAANAPESLGPAPVCDPSSGYFPHSVSIRAPHPPDSPRAPPLG